MAVNEVPVAVIAPMQPTAINAASNPYSIAVTPDSSVMLAKANEVLLPMN